MASRTATKAALAAATTPLLAVSSVLMELAAGGATAPPSSQACGGGGTPQTVAGRRLDAEQMGNARTVVAVVAGRHLPVYAATVAVPPAYTESTLHNYTTQTDHD